MRWKKIDRYFERTEKDWVLVQFKEKDSDFYPLPVVAEYVEGTGWETEDDKSYNRINKYYNEMCEAVAFINIPKFEAEELEETATTSVNVETNDGVICGVNNGAITDKRSDTVGVNNKAAGSFVFGNPAPGTRAEEFNYRWRDEKPEYRTLKTDADGVISAWDKNGHWLYDLCPECGDPVDYDARTSLYTGEKYAYCKNCGTVKMKEKATDYREDIDESGHDEYGILGKSFYDAMENVKNLKNTITEATKKNVNVSISRSGVSVIGNEIYINGQKLPPHPTEGKLTSLRNVSIINNRIKVNGYEFKDGEWKR